MQIKMATRPGSGSGRRVCILRVGWVRAFFGFTNLYYRDRVTILYLTIYINTSWGIVHYYFITVTFEIFIHEIILHDIK